MAESTNSVRTNAAAVMLGISPSTLRSWEQRYGFPRPRRSEGGHRQYLLSEVEALRVALAQTPQVSQAIDVARGESVDPSQSLVNALALGDTSSADLLVEGSIAARKLERTIQEVLLPALQTIIKLDGDRSAVWSVASRWSDRWFARASQFSPPANREGSAILLDASSGERDPDRPAIDALHMGIERSGHEVLRVHASADMLSIGRMFRRLDEPRIALIAGGDASLDSIGRGVYAIRSMDTTVMVAGFRFPVSGASGLKRLPGEPIEAALELSELIVSADHGRSLAAPVASEAELRSTG